jgi:hypothetical protein
VGNSIFAVAIRVELSSGLWVSSSSLAKEDACNAADLVAGASATEVDFDVEGATSAASSIVDDGVMIAASCLQGSFFNCGSYLVVRISIA